MRTRLFLIIASLAVGFFIIRWQQPALSAGTNEFVWTAKYTGQNLRYPTGLFKVPSANGGPAANLIFIADTGNNQIKMFQAGAGITTIAGSGTAGSADGSPTTAQFNGPTGILGPGYVTLANPQHTDYSAAYLLNVVDTNNHSIRRVCKEIKVAVGGAAICGASSSVTTIANSSNSLNAPALGVPIYTLNGVRYLADSATHTIAQVDTSNSVSVFAGAFNTPGYADGALTQARFTGPTKIAAGPTNVFYVADVGNFRIREINGSTVSTLAGNGQRGYVDGPGSEAEFSLPTSMAYDPTDGSVYVADAGNYCIRRIDSAGNVTTYAGSNSAGNVDGSLTSARFGAPTDIIIDGRVMYVSDATNHSIRKIDMNAQTVATFIN